MDVNRRLLPQLLLGLLLLARAVRADQVQEALQTRLEQSVQYLTADQLEGRSIGSRGLDLAAEYVARQFAAAGLKTDGFDKTPFQRFTLSDLAHLGPRNSLLLLGPAREPGGPPQRLELRLGQDFTPLSPSGSARFDLPLAFVGYGITAAGEKFDEYAGLDVKGKLVVVVRREPEQNNPQSVFNGAATSPYATFRRKIDNALAHQAAGVLFCTDRFSIDHELAELGRKIKAASAKLAAQPPQNQPPAEALLREIAALKAQLKSLEDPLLAFESALTGTVRTTIPVLQCRRAVIDRVLQAATGRSLRAWEAATDQGPTPQPAALPGWRAVGQTDVVLPQIPLRNVIGQLPGRGALAPEALLVGAHYDHVGRGRYGSLAGSKEIHPGADDNASGTAVLIELARLVADQTTAAATDDGRPRRQILFAAFTAEERGFLGSRHYVEHPLAPLSQTVAMLNFDMVGRLRDSRLMVLGTGTAAVFDGLLDKANEPLGLKLIRLPLNLGPSDQVPFQQRGIAAMSFFTGLHGDYHRPSDTADKLNLRGMAQIALLARDVIVGLANVEPRPQYVAEKPAAKAQPAPPQATADPNRRASKDYSGRSATAP